LLEFIPQIPKVLEVLQKDRAQAGVMWDNILPLFAPLMANPNGEVARAAMKSIVDSAPLICSDDKGQKLFFVILSAVHDDSNEDLRVASIELLGDTVASFGGNLCESFIAPDIESLVDSDSLKLRKVTAQIIPKVAQVMPVDSFTRRLAPVFLKLCNDTVWSVRKAAIEGLVMVFKASDPGVRAQLTDVLKKCLVDKSRWVKLTAQQQLGPFIIQAGKSVDVEVVQAYLKLSDSETEQELRSSCAYYFPGVLLTLEVEAWPVLQPTFNQMCFDELLKVRKSLAASINEVGLVIGPERAEVDLVRAFDSLLKDRDQTVKLTALMNFSRFLETVPIATRDLHINELGSFVKQKDNWRLREVVARQMPKLATLFSIETTYSSLLDLAALLVKDSVGAVRLAAAPALGSLLTRLYLEKEEWGLQYAEQLKELAQSKTYHDRQVFTLGCSLVATSPVFSALLAESFARLAWDPVSNVRVSAAQIVKAAVLSSPTTYWKRLSQQLQLDSDDDVKYSAGRQYDAARGLRTESTQAPDNPTLAPLLRRPCQAPSAADEVTTFVMSADDLQTGELEGRSAVVPAVSFVCDFVELEEEYPKTS
jgi:serine/threonine-protein phosphatase 4 regulatory subunit 1